MACESFCKAWRRNSWTTSPFWSTGQINHSHGNSKGSDDLPTVKAFTQRWEFSSRRTEVRGKNAGVCLLRTLFLISFEARWCAANPQDLAQLYSVKETMTSGWWAAPPIQSKSLNSTSGHQERCICQLSSSFKSHSWKKKESTSFLAGIVRQPGSRRKTFWCSSHTPMIIHNSPGMLQRPRAAWDVVVARLTARDKFTDGTMSKNNPMTSEWRGRGRGAQCSGLSPSSTTTLCSPLLLNSSHFMFVIDIWTEQLAELVHPNNTIHVYSLSLSGIEPCWYTASIGQDFQKEIVYKYILNSIHVQCFGDQTDVWNPQQIQCNMFL